MPAADGTATTDTFPAVGSAATATNSNTPPATTAVTERLHVDRI